MRTVSKALSTRAITCSIACLLLGLAPQLRADLISEFPFDGDTLDAGPGGNDGTFVGEIDPIYVDDRDGNPESALQFDGVDDFVQLLQTSGLPLYNNPEFSVTMWVNGSPQDPGATGGDNRVWSEGSTTNNTPLYNIGTANDGATPAVDIFVRDTATQINHAKYGTAFDGTWHHIAVVDTLLDGVYTIIVYVDAVEVGRSTYPRNAMALDTSTIGGILRGTSCCWFQGALDDVRLYDHALTPEEVIDDYGVIDCPDNGDTHCVGTPTVVGPTGSTPGNYAVTVVADDDTGDGIMYTFVAESGAGAIRQVGPQADPTGILTLPAGSWTITASVDDDDFCQDVAADASCTAVVVDVVPSTPQLVGHWTFDGTLDDASGNGNDGMLLSGLPPVYIEGHDGADPGAISLDGTDLVNVTHATDLPLLAHEALSIAMWVKGGPQPDYRVWSEASTATNTPLYNIGTQQGGTTWQADIYIRDNSNTAVVGHRLSQQQPFDNNWHHIAWIDDGGAAVLYIDGVLDGTNFAYTRNELHVDTTTIGGILRAAASHWFIGAIDEVYAWNYAISEEDVQNLIASRQCESDVGDTTCDDILITEPLDGEVPGVWMFDALDANDASLDTIVYAWELSRAEDGYTRVFPPTPSPTLTLPLGSGTWTISLAVDDDALCDDVSANAMCEREIVIEENPGEFLSHWTLDAQIDDELPAQNHADYSGTPPPFTTDRDGDPEGAVAFNGTDGLLLVQQNEDLPLYYNPSFSVAMWVRGAPITGVVDRRVWSEGSTASNTPLFNIGTDSAAAPTGVVDIFIRDDAGTLAIPHVKSTGIAFDLEWHHIAWVDDNGFALLYIDGELDATNFSYIRPILTLDTTTIGGIQRAAASHWFNGDIDDVRVYTRAITAAEVAELAGAEPPDGVGPFLRGDCSQDGERNLTDGIFLLNFLFLGGPNPSCAAACDNNGDGRLDITTAVYLFNFLFLGGPNPPAPFAACGMSSTDVDLATGCADPAGCQ